MIRRAPLFAVAVAVSAAALLAACATRAPAPPAADAPAAALTPATILRPVERVEPGQFAFQGALTQGGLAIGQAPPGTRAVLFDGVPVPLAADGRFLIGFGRDAPAAATIDALLPDNRRAHQTLTITARGWQIERIPQLRQPPPGVPPDPAAIARRAAEVAAFRAVRAHSSDLMNWTERFIRPATGRVSGVYGSQRILGGVPMSPHLGLDIARPAGTPVVAPAGGIVTLASPPAFMLEGNMVFIDHGHGLTSILMHLSRVDVRVGQRVRQGDVIGAVGMTGRATGPHLHWAMNWGEVKIDPQLLVTPQPR
jgi:murein DD-endopeptidase MepM/ murein hydrolase activator NlpD